MREMEARRPADSYLSSPKKGLEPLLHRKPFRFYDAEINGVPKRSIVSDHMRAKYSFLFRAQSFNCFSGNCVIHVGLELHSLTFQLLEGIPEQQEFGFRIDSGTLPLFSDPGPANFKSPVRRIHISVSRRSTDLRVLSVDDRKWKRVTGIATSQGRFNVFPHIKSSSNRMGVMIPQFRVQANIAQRIKVLDG